MDEKLQLNAKTNLDYGNLLKIRFDQLRIKDTLKTRLAPQGLLRQDRRNGLTFGSRTKMR